jgi:hypothetical protein
MPVLSPIFLSILPYFFFLGGGHFLIYACIMYTIENRPCLPLNDPENQTKYLYVVMSQHYFIWPRPNRRISFGKKPSLAPNPWSNFHTGDPRYQITDFNPNLFVIFSASRKRSARHTYGAIYL